MKLLYIKSIKHNYEKNKQLLVKKILKFKMIMNLLSQLAKAIKKK